MSLTSVGAKLDTCRPFTRAAAVAAGISPKQLRGPSYRRLGHGVYVSAAVPNTPAQRAAAAVLPFPDGSWASHASAARIHGVPIPTLPDEHVTVVSARHRRLRGGVVCHLRPPGQTRFLDGVRVSSYGQMFVELAEQLGLVDLVVVGDHLARWNGLVPDKLVVFCEASTLPGAPLAARAARHVRLKVDSPMETRTRMLLVLAGLPEPEINPTIRAVDGEPLRRYDLHYKRSRTIVEYDGQLHVEQWEDDVDRREDIADEGNRIIVVTSRGIYRHPERTLQRVCRALRARGEPGVPDRLSDEWRPHFPGWS